MDSAKWATTASSGLRSRAEQRLSDNSLVSDNLTQDMDTRRLLYELQVHHIELKMQNEELMLANTKLSEHTTHLNKIITNTPAGYFRIDLEGRFLKVNNSWLRMQGYNSPDEIIGKDFSTMQVDSISESALKHFAELRKGLAISSGEFSSRRKDGSLGYHTFCAHPVIHSDEIIGFDWFIIDISERRKLEEVQAFLLHSVLTNTGEKPFDSLARFLAQITSMEYVCINRFSDDGLSTRTLAIYNQGHFEDNVSYSLKGTLCGEVAVKKTCCYTRNVCKLFPNDAELQVLKAESCIGETLWSSVGEPIGLIAVIGQKPLDNPRQTEIILNLVAVRAAAELERIEADEVREKLRGQLSQSQKMEAIGRLAGGVAHDFNNMLTVIISHAECALRKLDPTQPFFEDMQEIHKAAERSANMTRQLLAFARKQLIMPKVLDLNETVEGMHNMLRRLIGEKINLIWQPGAGLWPIKMDPNQVEQILANLCVNARDAIADIGSLTISTENAILDTEQCITHNGSSPGDYVSLVVSDSGCGMNEDMLANIFEPFFTTKDVSKGTGLGLASVHGIVEQNKGFITVESEPDKGTTFRIYLPCYHDKTMEMRPEDAAISSAQGNETILIVEDESAILGIISLLLKGYGYNVLIAATPDEAMKLSEKHAGAINLLLTDVKMPKMNGRDLARKLLSLYPKLKCLFMSGYTADILTSEGLLDAGVNFISKPFQVNALADKVREILDAK